MKDLGFYPILALGGILLLMLAQGAPLLASLAVIGVLVLMYFLGERIYKHAPKARSRKKYAFIEDESIFNNSILVLIAAVIKSDGKEGKTEINYIEKALHIHFSPERVHKQIHFIKRLVKRERLDYKDICNTIYLNYQFNEKIQLLHFLIGVVCSDGFLSRKERKVIADICNKIKVPHQALNGIYNMFNFISEEEAERRRQQRKQKKKSGSYALARAYEILGLELSATVDDIKTAYRKLAMKHHPDRLIHLGSEHQKSAKEKFQSISKAYELIKTEKGFS